MDIRKDLSFFNNNILTQVCFGLYQVQLHFVRPEGENFHYEDLNVEVGCDLEYERADGSIQKWDSENSRATFICLNSLMEIPVIDAVCDAKNDLHLKFENGDCLRIISAHGPHESYIVHYKGDFEVIGFD